MLEDSNKPQIAHPRKWIVTPCDGNPSRTYWRCAPWSIALCFVDGCSLYVLSKDGDDRATAYKDELEAAMRAAREDEGRNERLSDGFGAGD